MAEPIERVSALITLLPGGEPFVSTALGCMGLALPKIGRFTEAGGLLLARTAPSQVLAMRVGNGGESGAGDAEGGGEDAGSALMEELAPLRAVAGVIDLSDARLAVRVEGRHAAEALARLLPIDLDPSRFGPGQCATTLMAHLSVLVLQHGPADYELQCGRSFGMSFLRAIESVAA